jgi:hypothetical protein
MVSVNQFLDVDASSRGPPGPPGPNTIGPNFVFVSILRDLPVAIGGVITLVAGRAYYITTEIDLLGARLVGGANTVIIGSSSENCILRSTGLGVGVPLFSSGWSTPIRDITFTGCDTALSIVGTGPAQPANPALDWRGVNFLDVPNVGVIQDIDNFIFTEGAFLSSAGLRFTGNVGTVAFNQCIFTSTSGVPIIEIDESTTVSRRFRTTYSSFVIGGGVGIRVDPSAVIPVEGYALDTINFTTFAGGSPTSGVGYLDNKVRWSDCRGVTNTSIFGNYYFAGSVQTMEPTTAPLGTIVPGAYQASPINQKFDAVGDGSFEYVGALSRDFQVSVVATIESPSNQRLEYSLNIVVVEEGVPGVVPGGTMSATTTNSDRPINVVSQAISTLDPGSAVYVSISAGSPATTITVTNLTVLIKALN